MTRRVVRALPVFALIAAPILLAAQSPATPLIINAAVIDGTGSPSRLALVRFAKDRIVDVGRIAARPGETVVDARGLTLAPGFIEGDSDGPTSRPGSSTVDD